jgi:hypothetical protein
MLAETRILRPLMVVPVIAALFAGYFAFALPWMETWGATEAEQQQALPGDELVPNPGTQTTRAVTIHAPADEVWARLVQIGQDRAGFYSYDWLENLFLADIHDTDVVRPEWQQRQAGDFIRATRPDFAGGAFKDQLGWDVPVVVPGQALVLKNWGTFYIQPVDGETSRLIIRTRAGEANSGVVTKILDTVLGDAGFEPVHFVMERQMLLGIKHAAEGTESGPVIVRTVAVVGWLAAGAAVLALFLVRRAWRGWLAFPMALVALVLWRTSHPTAALAGFISLGLVTAGAPHYGWRGWPKLPALAAVVMLTLLFSTDAYITFGLLFTAVLAGVAVAWLGQGGEPAKRAGIMGRPAGHALR